MRMHDAVHQCVNINNRVMHRIVQCRERNVYVQCKFRQPDCLWILYQFRVRVCGCVMQRLYRNPSQRMQRLHPEHYM